MREAIPDGFQSDAATEVLDDFRVEGPVRLKIRSLQGGKKKKTFRIRRPVVHDMLATLGRHLDDGYM